MRTAQELADALRSAADEAITLSGGHNPRVLRLRGIIEEVVQEELLGVRPPRATNKPTNAAYGNNDRTSNRV
jgi:hypothetical protein